MTKSAIILIHENIKDKTQTFIYELSVFTDKKKRNVKVKHAISEVFDILKIVLDDWSFIYYDLVLTTIAPEYIFLCLWWILRPDNFITSDCCYNYSADNNKNLEPWGSSLFHCNQVKFWHLVVKMWHTPLEVRLDAIKTN